MWIFSYITYNCLYGLMRQQHNCNIKTVTTTICSEKRNNSCGGCLWNCVDFHFQHTRRWHAHCARSPGFSHWLRYNFRFFNSLSFFFSLVDFYFFFTGCVARCHKTCPLGLLFSLLLLLLSLPQRALELIFIYISGRWFSIIRVKLALAWFGLLDLNVICRTDCQTGRQTDSQTASAACLPLSLPLTLPGPD